MLCDLITYDSFYFLFNYRENGFEIDLYVIETVCAAALTWVMGQRYIQTSKIMPAGIVAGIRLVKAHFLLQRSLYGTTD